MNQQEPNTADTIIPNLYLGDKNAATDLELISKLELTHILSVDMIPLPQGAEYLVFVSSRSLKTSFCKMAQEIYKLRQTN